jgi:hypothetical protein
MNSHDKTHGYPAGYSPISGEENIHGNPRMKQGTTRAVTAGNAHGFGHKGSQKEGPLRNSGVKGAHRIGRTRGK